MAGYIVIAFLLAWYVLPRVMLWIQKRPQLSQAYGIPIFALISALFFGWSAEYLGGVAAITGAFIAGVGLSKLPATGMKHEIEQTTSHLAYVFLVPIFFVDVGLGTDLSTFPLDAVPFMLLLLLMAVISKVFGAGLGARMGGFDLRESLRVGVCMVSRGEVGLIIISIGLSSGLLDSSSELYASLFMVILLTTVLTPPMVRLVFQGKGEGVQSHAASRLARKENKSETYHVDYIQCRERRRSCHALAKCGRARRHRYQKRRLIQSAAQDHARQPGGAAAYRQFNDQRDGLRTA